MRHRYVTIAEDAPGYFELEIKRSRFLGVARGIVDEPTARQVIETERKQYPDARHHCSAFTYLPAGWEHGVQAVQHSNDDGEPSGTAGRPMLDVLLGSEMQNVCVIVTRYFGGIKLGTGGLVRAYSEAAQGAIAAAGRLEVKSAPVVSFDVAANRAAALESWLHSRNCKPLSVTWSNRVTFELAVEGYTQDELAASLAAQLGAPVTFGEAGIKVVRSRL